MANPVLVGTALIVTAFGMMTMISALTGNVRKGGEAGLKRIVLMAILVAIALVLTGCVNRAETSTKTTYVQLIMPDGTIIDGVLTGSLRYDDGWMTVTIDGVKYWTNPWRIVKWEGGEVE